MQSFYSLIKISPNQLAGDSLTVGIIARNNERFICRFSKSRMTAVKQLLHSDPTAVDYVEKLIKSKLKEVNLNLSRHEGELFEFHDILTQDYIDYLNRYSNGLVQFSTTFKILDYIDESKLDRLFKMLIDAVEPKAPQEREIEKIFKQKVQTRLIDKVRTRIHTNFKFDSTWIPSLFSQVQMDCIGKNGSLIGAYSLPHIGSRATAGVHVNSYINVISHMTLKYAGGLLKDQNFYLISDEPHRVGSQEHKIWESIKKEDVLFKVISSDEVDMVAHKIETSGATTFLQD